jgi:hypothetical protein
MWTDINTKLKQDLVFPVSRGHVMCIPADYRDLDYKGKVPLLPEVSVLPLTKEQLALQECVGEMQNNWHRCQSSQPIRQKTHAFSDAAMRWEMQAFLNAATHWECTRFWTRQCARK